MKTVIIPLVELNVPGCDCTISAHRFDAEWCLDLHGYLNREEFAARLREINNYIKQYPLLSSKQKSYLTYVISGMAIFVAFVAFILIFTTEYSSINDITFPAVTIDGILGLLLPIGRKIIDQIAKNRTILFSQALQPVLDHYNRQENPTANWKLVWRVVVTHYSIKIDSHGNGSAKPVYAEQAELVVEINDALANLTAHTVRLNLPLTTVSRPSTVAPTSSTTVSRVSTINTTYPPRKGVS
ncbi:7234_t:CDS:1 [Paraglomus occultum]|uniref:7234_t:CDS:1 n=1 Tax=Paraglomus occultum TaxID=144539 RepID=A0A9N9CB63_9GLOM|nr:7234_t:CDS:1 [Paraglomus occultum]